METVETDGDLPSPRLARLLGALPLSRGVVHVVAVCEDQAGDLRVLRIGPRSPQSDCDFLLLQAARARAEAIVTTGAILRAEPDLRWTLQGPGSAPEELGEWRRELGLQGSPTVAVLTSGFDLDLGHPGLRDGVTPLVVTGREGSRSLAAPAGRLGIEVAALAEPGIRSTLDELRRRGLRRITVEAGPSTAAGLYVAREGSVGVDELWLSIFGGRPVAETVGSTLLRRRDLERVLRPASEAVTVVEPSGPWRFQRFRPTVRSDG